MKWQSAPKKKQCVQKKNAEDDETTERREKKKFNRSAEKIAENNNKVRIYKRHGFFFVLSFIPRFGDGIINCRLRAVKKIGRKKWNV